MAIPILLPCDGCGQPASADHIAARLQRLEWTTRYRPVHIQAVLLGAVVPPVPDQFLYNPTGQFAGQASFLLNTLRVQMAGMSRDSALVDFQKRGLLLSHVLECPLEPNVTAAEAQVLLAKQIPIVTARIRRSLKPKRVLLLSAALDSFADQLSSEALNCVVIRTPLDLAQGQTVPEMDLNRAFLDALPALAAHGG